MVEINHIKKATYYCRWPFVYLFNAINLFYFVYAGILLQYLYNKPFNLSQIQIIALLPVRTTYFIVYLTCCMRMQQRFYYFMGFTLSNKIGLSANYSFIIVDSLSNLYFAFGFYWFWLRMSPTWRCRPYTVEKHFLCMVLPIYATNQCAGADVVPHAVNSSSAYIGLTALPCVFVLLYFFFSVTLL